MLPSSRVRVLVTGTERCWGYNWIRQLRSTTHVGPATATPAPQPALTYPERGAHPVPGARLRRPQRGISAQ